MFAGRLAVDDAIVRDNRTLLAFGVAHGYQYYIDDARLLSGDAGLVSAAFDDYADYQYTGAFAVEITDEPTVDVLEGNLTTVAQLGQELERRNRATGRALPLTAIARPSVNFVPGSDRVIPALRLALGPNARFSVDAHTIDPSIWARFLSLFDITHGHPAPGTDYDIQLTVPMTRWVAAASGAARSPDVTGESRAAYLTIAAGYAGAGVHSVMLFTGFAVDDNIYDDHFEGALVDTKVRRLVQGALARYRQLVPG